MITGENKPRDWHAHYRQEIAQARDSNVVISFPKSGRTWHRLMMGAYLARKFDLDTSPMALDRLCKQAGIARIDYLHNGANIIDTLPPDDDLVASPELWRNRNIILLVRDPRDILVSAFFHTRFRSRTFDDDISAFIRDPVVGLIKIMTAYRRWKDNEKLAKNFLCLSYEQMSADPSGSFTRSLEFLNIPVDEAAIAHAVAYCSFENMQRYEQTNAFNNIRLAQRTEDPRGRKVREGRIGGFREHLSEADLSYIKQTIESCGGNPYAS